MNKLLLIPLLFLSLLVEAQNPYFEAKIINPTKQLFIPNDTTTAPTYLGEFRRMGASWYRCRATTGTWKWDLAVKDLTIMSVGGGVSLVSPLSKVDSAKFKTPTSVDNSVVVAGTDSTVDFSVRPQVNSIGSGTSVLLAQSQGRFLTINPPSVMATYTVNLPASPIAGDWVRIGVGGTMTSGTVVTSFTVAASATIVGTAITSSALTYGTSLFYMSNGTYWYRLQ